MGAMKAIAEAQAPGFKSEALTRWQMYGQIPTRSELQHILDAVYDWGIRSGKRKQ